MDKLKKIIHKISNVAFGTDENISFTLACAFFFTGTLLTLFAITFNQGSREFLALIYPSSLCFYLCLLIGQGYDKFYKLLWEIMRFIFFLIFLLGALLIFLNLEKYNDIRFYVSITVMVILILFCFYYLVVKTKSIFRLLKKIFFQIRNKLFSINHSSSGIKKIIENLTSFLLLIAGLLVAAKSIFETFNQIVQYISPLFS